MGGRTMSKKPKKDVQSGERIWKSENRSGLKSVNRSGLKNTGHTL
jgi:hypothetical protein